MTDKHPRDPALSLESEFSDIPFPSGLSSLFDETEELDESDELGQALSEFHRRTRLGEAIDPARFCESHPNIKSSLWKLLLIHLVCEEFAGLFEPLAEEAWPHPGDTFLGLRLHRLLGRGAFARVFLATEDEIGNRLVAAKVAPQGGAEASTQGRLDHPGIVPVLSVKQELTTGLTVVVMPYRGNATLHDVLDRVQKSGRTPPERPELLLEVARARATEDLPQEPTDPVLREGTYVEAILHLLAQTAHALDYVHGKEILHLDLKPSNVLLTPDGRPLLLDFNLAFDPRLRRQRLGGTIPYMAPEQLRLPVIDGPLSAPGSSSPASLPRITDSGQPPAKGEKPRCAFDTRTDLFSLGVILYELLAGRHPFGPLTLPHSEQEIRALLLARQQQGYQPLHEANPTVGRRLSALVDRCLALDRDARPATARELAGALEAEQRRFRRRRQFRDLTPALFTGTLMVVLGVVLLGLWLIQRPSYSQHEYRQGMEAFSQEDYKGTVEHLSRALQADPTLDQAHFPLARALDRADRLAEAHRQYEEALQHEDSPDVRVCLAHCLWREGKNLNTALDLYEKALASGYESAAVYNNLAAICIRAPRETRPHRSGFRYELAARSLNRALELDPTFWPAYANQHRLENALASLYPNYLPLRGLETARHWLPNKEARPEDYLMAAFLYGWTGGRLDARAALGSCLAVAGHAIAAEDPPGNDSRAALGSWLAVAGNELSGGQPAARRGLQAFLLNRQDYHHRAQSYLRQAWSMGARLKGWIEHPRLKSFVASVPEVLTPSPVPIVSDPGPPALDPLGR
jgi:serine/threonine protein kinase